MFEKDRGEWLAKMHRYLAANPKFALSRARLILDNRPLDWDDNIPKEWAVAFLEEADGRSH